MIVRVGISSAPSADRRGFTLIELLVTMAIISILASLIMFAMSSAQEAARESRTKAVVAVLNGLLMERWDSYRTRRVPVDTAGLTPALAKQRRLNGLRELMRLEMPDRWDDVTTDPQYQPKPALYQAYRAFYDSKKPSPENQGAECLYLIITLATGDGEARQHFSENDIGDVDGDGALEFLDGWGKPISFLRWAAGFVSERQPLILGRREPEIDHDPFDLLRIDVDAYRLVPLIYSAGSDGAFDIIAAPDGTTFQYPKDSSGFIDPYAVVASGKQMGAPYDNNSNGIADHLDNIHNHLIGLK